MVYAGDGPYRRSRGTEAEDIEIAAGRGLSPRPAPATTRPGVRTAPRRVRASATTHARAGRARRFRAGRRAAEAQAWVWSDRAAWPFSFVNICEVLGFDVDAMRARLLTRYPAPRRRARVRSPIRGRMVSLAVRRSASAPGRLGAIAT